MVILLTVLCCGARKSYEIRAIERIICTKKNALTAQEALRLKDMNDRYLGECIKKSAHSI